MNVAETASKRVIQKNEEATGDLIGNKIEIKLLHQVKQKIKKRRRKTRNIHATRKKTRKY